MPLTILLGGCFVAFARGEAGPGHPGDWAWAAAVTWRPTGRLRDEGAPPDVLLVDATGLDHPRRAGLAIHLGAVLGIPTVASRTGPCTRPTPHPRTAAGASSPVSAAGEVVAHAVRIRDGARPVIAHAGWRTDADGGPFGGDPGLHPGVSDARAAR